MKKSIWQFEVELFVLFLLFKDREAHMLTRRNSQEYVGLVHFVPLLFFYQSSLSLFCSFMEFQIYVSTAILTKEHKVFLAIVYDNQYNNNTNTSISCVCIHYISIFLSVNTCLLHRFRQRIISAIRCCKEGKCLLIFSTWNLAFTASSGCLPLFFMNTLTILTITMALRCRAQTPVVQVSFFT